MKYLIILPLILLFSCKIFKQKESKTNGSNATNSADSGAVKKSNNSSQSELEWTKLILQYGKKDSAVTNNYFTLPNGTKQPQPQVIIYETGKGKNATTASTYDSSWDKKFNQLQTLITEMASQNKTSVLSFGQIIVLVLGGVVLLAIILILYHKISLKSIITKVLP